MVQPFNDDEDLRQRLSFLGPNQSQWGLSQKLMDATLEMETMVGRQVEEELQPTVEDQTDFSLAYSNLHEVIKVEIQSFHDGYEQTVDSSNYTVTKDPTRDDPTNISFDSTWAEDNLFNNDYRLRVYYVPELYKRLELRLAELDLTVLSSIQTGDEQRQAMADKAEERIMALQKRINRTNQNLGDKDAGDSLPANYNFPGER